MEGVRTVKEPLDAAPMNVLTDINQLVNIPLTGS
jgi:hypothetical protein